MPTMVAWQFSDITTTGPDPFPQSSSFNGDAIGASTFTIGPSAGSILLDVTDNDTEFEDGDNASQALTSDTVFNGTTYTAGQHAGANYSYIVRPEGSVDPADEIQIWIVRLGGTSGESVAIVAESPLAKGVTYDFVAQPEWAGSPTVAYSSVFVCLAAGTRVATPSGEIPVQDLKLGDRLLTLDRGAQPVLWISHAVKRFEGRADPGRPVLIPPGAVCGQAPSQGLRVSPQHRLLLQDEDGRQVLAPAKAFVGLRGIRILRGIRQVSYYNFLLPRHEIILANGLPVESFYPGRQALRTLPHGQRQRLFGLFPALIQHPGTGFGAPARPLLAAGEARRLIRAGRPWSRRGATGAGLPAALQSWPVTPRPC